MYQVNADRSPTRVPSDGWAPGVTWSVNYWWRGGGVRSVIPRYGPFPLRSYFTMQVGVLMSSFHINGADSSVVPGAPGFCLVPCCGTAVDIQGSSALARALPSMVIHEWMVGAKLNCRLGG